MARRIVEAGHDLTIWARRASTLDPFADTAAVAVATPAEVGSRSEFVEICVMADADVEDVVLRADGVLAGMAADGIIAIHSTVHPETCRRIGAKAALQGVRVIDAPVSGGAPAVNEGRLLVMTGGPYDAVERVRPVMAVYGDPVLYLGPLGSGQIAKLLNNFVFTAQLGVALETFRFAERLGVDTAAVAEVLANGSGGSRGISVVAGGGFGTASLKGVAETVLTKDVGLMADVAAGAGVDLPTHLAEMARATLRMYAEG